MNYKGLAGLAFLGLVAFVGTSAVTSTEAAAKDNWYIGVDSRGGVSIGYSNHDRGFRLHKRHHKHSRYYGRPHRGKHFKRHRHGPRHVHRNHRRGPSYGVHIRYTYNKFGDCDPVYSNSRWRGRPAKVGGYMCYDRDGYGYVDSRSRHLIHYY